MADAAAAAAAAALFSHLSAACESGRDFSSRFVRAAACAGVGGGAAAGDLRDSCARDAVPVDLNVTGQQWDAPNVWPPRAPLLQADWLEQRPLDAGRAGGERVYAKYDGAELCARGGGGEYAMQESVGCAGAAAAAL